MSSFEDTTTYEQSLRIIGQVKWFNNKAGYGFITVSSGENKGKDIFIHYSAIRVVNSQYKYLVQGEYVEFNLVNSTSSEHEFQAVEISGINNGSLMCETRNNSVVQYATDVKHNFQQHRSRFGARPVSRSSHRDESGSQYPTRKEPLEDAAVNARSGDGDFKTVQRRRPIAPRKKTAEHGVGVSI
jgi:cold shock CspA family protein